MTVAGPPNFALFGGVHLVILALTAAAVVGMVVAARRDVAGRAVRLGEGVLAAALFATYPAKVLVDLFSSGSAWDGRLPGHLCDVAAYVAGFALVTRRPLLAELAYYWGLAGTLQGLVTPALELGFPHPEFFRFFLLHVSVVVAALYLPLGLRLTPRPWSWWRAFLWLQVYAVAAAAVNLATGANYGFLREKPKSASLIDWLGDWPWYILALELVALAFFFLLYLPFRKRSRANPPAP